VAEFYIKVIQLIDSCLVCLMWRGISGWKIKFLGMRRTKNLNMILPITTYSN